MDLYRLGYTPPPKTRTFFRKEAITWGRLRIFLKKILADIYGSSWAFCAHFRFKKTTPGRWKSCSKFKTQNFFETKNFFKNFQNFIFIAFLAFSGDRDLFKSVEFFWKFEKLTEIWPFPWRVQDLLLYPFWPPFWGRFWPGQGQAGPNFSEKRS